MGPRPMGGMAMPGGMMGNAMVQSTNVETPAMYCVTLAEHELSVPNVARDDDQLLWQAMGNMGMGGGMVMPGAMGMPSGAMGMGGMGPMGNMGALPGTMNDPRMGNGPNNPASNGSTADPRFRSGMQGGDPRFR